MLPQPGSVFGSYDVGERLGQGGMGVVLRAVHRDLQREVALKVLAPQLSGDDEYRARFLSEARTLARLESPHVVGIYDAGEQDGSLYLAMQLVTDGDLSVWLREYGAMPPATALDLLRQVARGLAAAHDAGVLHRDIKASNVLLRRLPDGGTRAYLCDFGIAQTEDVAHTRTGGVVGTWAYLAPERHHGVPASVASDVYALGCLLWVLLTGRTPYQGTTEMEIALGHLNAPVPQLPGASPEVRRVNHLVRLLMDKDPARRPASAAAVLEAIDRADGEAPTRPGTPGLPAAPRPASASRSPRRGRMLAVGAAALVLLAGSVTAGVLLTRDDPGGDGGGGEPGGGSTPLGEVAFADDRDPGVSDAPLTATDCADVDGGFRVGGMLPLERASQSAMVAAVGLAVSDINGAGGVGGEEACTVLVEEGSEFDTDAAVVTAATLAEDEDPSVVVGPAQTALVEAVAETFQRAEVPFISPYAASSSLSGISPYFFRTVGGGGTARADAFVQVAADDGAQSIAYLVPGWNESSIAFRDETQTLAEERGLTCVFGCTGEPGQLVAGGNAAGLPVGEAVTAAVTSGADRVVVMTEPPQTALAELAALGSRQQVLVTIIEASTNLYDQPDLNARITGVTTGAPPVGAFGPRVADWGNELGGLEIPSDDPYRYAPEAYDAVVLAALAAVRGGATDGRTVADNLRSVSGDGDGIPCPTYRRCAALLESGRDVAYRGLAVQAPIDEEGDLTRAEFSVYGWDESGYLERSPRDVVTATKDGTAAE